MAKHPHKLMLIDGRTWRCVLDGCSFFVHLGLAHVIVGKRIVCWKCEDTFIVSKELSTREPRPSCELCQTGLGVTWDEMEKIIEQQIIDGKKRNQQPVEEDVIEVYEPDEHQTEHAADCGVYDGLECNCGYES